MFDALVARAVAFELDATIGRGRVQAVLPLDDLSVGFEVYARPTRHYVLASADATTGRLQLVSTKLRAAPAYSGSFILLLKKYLDGALVNRVEALPRERVIRIQFDHAEFGLVTFVAEIMGRYSNLILVDGAGTVLDSIKRVSPSMSRARSVLPRTPYLPPPPQNKFDPLLLSVDQLVRVLADARAEPLWQTLVRTVAGTSPLLARELAFRVAGSTDAEADPGHASLLLTLLQTIWQALPVPTLALEADRPVDVAAFALDHARETRTLDSMSAALEQFFGAVESYAAVKVPLQAQLQSARERLERKRAALEREIVPADEVERLRVSGELILAHLANIQPGARVLRAEMIPGQPLDIALDPRRKPVENAQRYFAEYHRARDAAESVPARLREAVAEVEFADQVLQDLEDAESRAEIEAALAEAREAGLLEAGKKRTAAGMVSGPRSFRSPDGFTVLAGRNARQNEEVTFSRAGGDDLWLHARGAAGSHVVILAQGQAVPETTVEFAAEIAAYYSRSREEAWADVMVTPRKNVRRVTGRAAHPGLVQVRGERTVRVRPASDRELQQG